MGREAGELLPLGTRAPLVARLEPSVVRQLDRGPVPLAEFGERFAHLVGEVVALHHGEARVALLAVIWNHPLKDRAARRERLRLFAPWAAAALTEAQARAAAREDLRRESVLRHAATELAATHDRQVAQQIVVDAARSGLRAAACLVERSSGRVLSGDAEVTEALVRWSIDTEPKGGEADTPIPQAQQADAPLRAVIEDNLVLIAWRANPQLSQVDAAWLDQVATVARVVLERCAVHDQLRVEDHRLRASLEAMPAPCALWDTSGTLVLANAAYRTLGLDGVPPGRPSPTGVNEEEVVVGDPPRIFVVVTVPVDEGQYVVSLYREISREREALRAKDELLAMVGHELRTPLTSIYGYSQMMARQLGVVQQQVDQLNRLIGDFMDATRLEGGQLPLSREPVNLAELARMAADRFRGAHERRLLRLELTDVPWIEGDPARLGQVLDNLLSNAAKYSPADQEILLAVRADAGQVILSVQDHGVGIAPEHLPHLFDRFYRVRGASTEHVKGLGLGLSIVRDLVAAHGGQVWAESAGPGQGSTFSIRLPGPGQPCTAVASDTLGDVSNEPEQPGWPPVG